MKLIPIVIGCALLLFAVTGMARQDKTLICHVGNELGPNGEEYDPDCVPDEFNGYCSADAGKIDLIVVAKADKHLDNDSHSWNGISDYEPGDVGASGEGTEDSDGDGVDDGCQPPETCPCWDEDELQAVTAENQLSYASCSSEDVIDLYPGFAVIQNDAVTPGVEGGFNASREEGLFGSVCGTRDEPPFELDITDEEASACIAQIEQRCADIGDPIIEPAVSLSCPCWNDLTEPELAALLNSEEWSDPSCGDSGAIAQAVDQADSLPYMTANYFVNACTITTSERDVTLGLSASETDTCVSEIVSVIEQIDACQ